jgi:periplasmic protein CpxP/Spy
MQPEITPAPQPAAPRRRRFVAIAAFAALIGAGGVVAAQNYGPPRFGPSMMMGRGGPMNMDPAAMADRADRGIRHLAIEIDATPEQTEKLRTIARDLAKDMAQYRDAGPQARQEARDLLTRATLTRDDIEKFRAEQVGKIDAATKRIAQALGDAAEVLTPEQRQKLAARLPQPGRGPGPGGQGSPDNRGPGGFWRR